jgi:hypothetical protein
MQFQYRAGGIFKEKYVFEKQAKYLLMSIYI